MTVIRNVQPAIKTAQLDTVLLWQHNEAFNLQALIAAKQAFFDSNYTQFFTDWQRDVFNLNTANEFGCAVWAIILDLPLGTNVVGRPAANYFGFGGGRSNFTANFSATDKQMGALAPLTIQQRRLLLKLRYLQLTTRCDVLGVNAALKWIFNGQARVGQSTAMGASTYYLSSEFPKNVLAIIEDFDLFPRPAGTGLKIVFVEHKYFSFGHNQNNFTANFRATAFGGASGGNSGGSAGSTTGWGSGWGSAWGN